MNLKRYEILSALPAYGPMHISITGNTVPFYGAGFPVRFYKTDGTHWVANFERGWTDLEAVLEFEKSQNILVIAGGTCYVMQPDNVKPVEVFGLNYSDLLKASMDRVVLQADGGLTIIEPNLSYWETELISYDEMKNLTIRDDIVTGLSFDVVDDTDQWVAFCYDINSKTLTGGRVELPENKKPWWKMR